MIIAQYNPANIAAIAPASATQVFQVSSNGTSSGIAAGAANLSVGKGFVFGLPFQVYMQGVAKVVTTGFAFKPGLLIGATAAAQTAYNSGTATGTLTAGASYPFFAKYELCADGTSQSLIGTMKFVLGQQATASALVAEAVIATTSLTGLSLPSASAPYSWPSPITGLDTAISNAPFLVLTPQLVTSVAASATSTVTLTSFVVTQ